MLGWTVVSCGMFVEFSSMIRACLVEIQIFHTEWKANANQNSTLPIDATAIVQHQGKIPAITLDLINDTN